MRTVSQFMRTIKQLTVRGSSQSIKDFYIHVHDLVDAAIIATAAKALTLPPINVPQIEANHFFLRSAAAELADNVLPPLSDLVSRPE